jgi:hypothetical protein
MSLKTKLLLRSTLIASTSVIYFLLAYIGFKDQDINLSKCDQYENIITDKGVGIHYGNRGRKSNVFFISLKGLDEDLGIYRMSKKYNDLLEKVNVGDRVKVYYRRNLDEDEKDNVNIDLIQVEKDGKILISKDEYEKKESMLIYIGLIAGIGTLIAAYAYFKYGNRVISATVKRRGNNENRKDFR